MSKKEEKKVEFKGIKDMPYVPVSLGTMRVNKTSSWRNYRPIIDSEKCTCCMMCWKFCPEPAIEPTCPPTVDLDYCKGCGICIEVCPVKAITPEMEGK